MHGHLKSTCSCITSARFSGSSSAVPSKHDVAARLAQLQHTQTLVRLVTWNINMLCGADGHSQVDARQVLEVLTGFEADVVVLQECPDASSSAGKHWHDFLLSQVRSHAMP